MDGHLEICSPPLEENGLMYKEKNDNQPHFILLPRKDVISINKDGRELCKAMSKVAIKKNKLVRGSRKTLFGKTNIAVLVPRLEETVQVLNLDSITRMVYKKMNGTELSLQSCALSMYSIVFQALKSLVIFVM